MAGLVAFGYAVFRFSDVVAIGAFRDDAVYIALGKAIASGDGYRSIYAPGDPVHMKYPPGMPLLFAAFWIAGGTLAVVSRLIAVFNIIASATAAGILWTLARNRLGLPGGVVLICVVGPFFFEAAIIWGRAVYPGALRGAWLSSAAGRP